MSGSGPAESAGAPDFSGFLFDPLRPWLERLPARPDADAIAALVAGAGLRTCSGQPVRLVPPEDDGLAYEERLWLQGRVETRRDNWHDFFNGLVWLAFPRAKAALNARHRSAWVESGAGSRGQARDAMTHLDECGILVTSTQAELLRLLGDFRWRELFWERRAAVRAHMEFWVFGHATYEQLLAPFRGLTAKAVLYEVGQDWQDMPRPAKLAALDARLAADLASGHYGSPRDLQPLPLLGIPGVTPASESAGYYDDPWQFRPGRRGQGGYNPHRESARQPLPAFGRGEESPGSAGQDAG